MVSKKDLVTKSGSEVGIGVSSVEIVAFSEDPDCVFVEGDIMRNRGFVGILDCSEFDRIT